MHPTVTVRAAQSAVGVIGSPIFVSPAEFSVHRTPLLCCMRTGTGGERASNTVRSSGPATASWIPTALIQPSLPTSAAASARARSARVCTSAGPTRVDVDAAAAEWGWTW